jgi:hypothetical protein
LYEAEAKRDQDEGQKNRLEITETLRPYFESSRTAEMVPPDDPVARSTSEWLFREESFTIPIIAISVLATITQMGEG